MLVCMLHGESKKQSVEERHHWLLWWGELVVLAARELIVELGGEAPRSE